jgi:uncharacterized protein (TIGR02118 family)
LTTLTVLYGVPSDPAAFDEHYRSVHLPLAHKIPDVQDVSVRKVVGTPDGSPPPYHLVVNLTFADAATFGAAMGSAEGQAAAADVANFATGGATLLISEDFA